MQRSWLWRTSVVLAASWWICQTASTTTWVPKHSLCTLLFAKGVCKVVYHWINSNAHPFTLSEVSWGFRPKKAPVVTQFSHNQRAWKQTYLRFNRQHSQPFNSWVLHCSCQACKSEIVALCYLDAISNCRKKLVHLKREGSKTSVSLMCDDFV